MRAIKPASHARVLSTTDKRNFMKRLEIRKAYLLFVLILGVFIMLPGCGSEGGGGEWDQPVSTTLTAPTTTAVAPLANATGVPVNTKIITAAFSKAMDQATLTPASFTLTYGTPAVAVTGGTVSYVTSSNAATLTLPAADLLKLTVYTATITTAATDENGVALASNFVWTFTTGTGTSTDTIPPTVTATGVYGITGATSGAIDLPVNRSTTAIFSEHMDPLSITTPPAFTLTYGAAPVVPVAGVVTYAVASKTTTFNPDDDLLPNTLYTSTITKAVKDLAGNTMLVDYVWTWTTGNLADTVRPTVLNTDPADLATDVPLNRDITATFSEEMDSLTITNLTFTVTGDGFPVPGGLVSYDPLTSVATFNPDIDLTAGVTYTATITADATDLAGNELEGNQLPLPPAASDYVWTFTPAAIVLPVVNLGLASTFGIAATAGVTNTGATQIDGDVVLNPTAECNAVTVDNTGGFGLCGGTPPTINGEVITPTYPDTTTAQNVTDDLRDAYLSITPANMPGATAIAAPTTLGDSIGAPLVEGDNLFYTGVYESITSILITGDLTLDAQFDPNATFVFQSASSIGSAPNSRILLANGAKASNVWWQAGSDATVETATEWQGNILAYRDVTMVTGASSCGRLFAGAFTDGLFVFDSNLVSVPGNPSAPPSCQ